MALHWAEQLPSEGGTTLDAWVAEVELERWHARVDGARLVLRGVDDEGQPLDGPFELRWESSALGQLAPTAMALLGEGAPLDSVLRLVAGRLVIAAVQQLDADLLRAGAGAAPTLWVSGDAPPALRLGVWETDGWTAPPGWFD